MSTGCRPARPSRVGLLLDVEGPLVDQPLVRPPRSLGQVLVLDGQAVVRSVAKMSMSAVIRSGSLPSTHTRSPPVSTTRQLVSTNSDVVVAGLLRVGLGPLDGIHGLGVELAGGRVDLGRPRLRRRSGCHVEGRLLDRVGTQVTQSTATTSNSAPSPTRTYPMLRRISCAALRSAPTSPNVTAKVTGW